MNNLEIEFRDVAKYYGTNLILQNINLQINKGEIIAIIGPSGSGKSTLIRCINQLETIEKGEIYIENQAISKLSWENLRKLRSKIGFVFQSFNLYPHLNILKNITLALEKVHQMEAAKAQTIALEMLQKVGLSEKQNAFPHQLSGGQQQRVAIARALSSSPHILLFDEPTSALDPEMIGEVLNVIKEIAKSNITMIIVSHEMNFVKEVADKVVFIDKGEILEIAKPESFFQAPQTKRAQDFLNKMNY